MVAISKRPNTPVFDDNFRRARAILKDRARNHVRMRAPGARPAGAGINLEMSMMPTLGKLYINQYIRASIAMLKRSLLPASTSTSRRTPKDERCRKRFFPSLEIVSR
jgi:hypothetical protein